MAETQKSDLSSSQEDYLETILGLIRQAGVARVRDIAERLEVGKSAVTSALKLLAKRKLVNYDPYQLITLTNQGRKAAEAVDQRHKIISRFLSEILGLDQTTAENNACRIEHAIDDELLEKLNCLVEFIESNPNVKGKDWLKTFIKFCSIKENKKVTTTLAKISPGNKARIVRIRGTPATNRKLADMGVTRNTMVTVQRIAPLGDPVEIKIRGYTKRSSKAS
ncbi:MAG: metal-dependent transcriptional regulator [Planctomycetota bacterium]|jgi:DtxR family Mn-dependent transcriptional regulator